MPRPRPAAAPRRLLRHNEDRTPSTRSALGRAHRSDLDPTPPHQHGRHSGPAHPIRTIPFLGQLVAEDTPRASVIRSGLFRCHTGRSLDDGSQRLPSPRVLTADQSVGPAERYERAIAAATCDGVRPGGVDDGEAERTRYWRASVMASSISPDRPSESRRSAAFLIRAVQEHPGTDRPAAQFAGVQTPSSTTGRGARMLMTARTSSRYAGHVLGLCRIGRPARAAAGSMSASQSRTACPGSKAASGPAAAVLPDPGRRARL